ncbi:hypothetical protein, partial [Enterococcus casseliflavus]|uniref:hypothetical protein n=1 Tax=Enterococcus casseliflavus TaxID=37734 RepID=UPI003D0B6940
IIGNPSLNHRYRKGFYSLFKTLQQNHRGNSLLNYETMVVLRPFFKKEKRSFLPSTFQPFPPLRRAKKIDVQGTSVEQKVDISLKSCYTNYVKRSCANNSPTAPFKTVAVLLFKRK